MAHTRDLYKTKLCTLYQKGNCPRQSCSFAHGETELRKFHGGSASGVYAGRHDGYRNADLRERLERRRTPPTRRRSPGRDGRGHPHGEKRASRDRGRSRSRSPVRRRPSSRSLSAQRSPSHRSDKRETKRLRTEASDAHFSDVSGEVGGDEGDLEDSVAKSKRSLSPHPRDRGLEEQIRVVQADMKTLTEQKNALEHTLQNKDLESSRLVARNMELESSLSTLQEEHKRLNSKMKRFLRVYSRYSRAQEDVRKTQAKLQRLADELPLDEEKLLTLHGEDSDVNFASDGEADRPSKYTNHVAPDFDGQPSSAVALVNGGTELQAGVPKDVLTVIPSVGKESQGDSDIHLLPRDGNTKKPSALREKSRAAKINRSCLEQNGINLKGEDADEGDWKRQSHVRLGFSDERSPAVELAVMRGRQSGTETSPSSKNLPTDKVRGRDSSFSLPSTGLAAHAQDHPLDLKDDSAQGQGDYSFHERNKLNVDLTLGSTSQFNLAGRSLPLSTAVANSHYVKQYKGEDEEVDVEAVEADGDDHVCTDLGMAGGGEAVAATSQ